MPKARAPEKPVKTPAEKKAEAKAPKREEKPTVKKEEKKEKVKDIKKAEETRAAKTSKVVPPKKKVAQELVIKEPTAKKTKETKATSGKK